MTDSLNLGKGYSDYMPPSVVTEALKQVACSSNPLMYQSTRGSVSYSRHLDCLGHTACAFTT